MVERKSNAKWVRDSRCKVLVCVVGAPGAAKRSGAEAGTTLLPALFGVTAGTRQDRAGSGSMWMHKDLSCPATCMKSEERDALEGPSGLSWIRAI